MTTTELRIKNSSLKTLESLKKRIPHAIELGLREGMTATVAHIRRKKLQGQELNTRSGDLRRSIRARVTKRGHKFIGSVGSNLDYAAIHEFGKVVTPTQSQWLTIPLDAAKTGSGVSRGGARSFSNTFFHMTKDKRLFIMQTQGKGFVPLFRLVKSVRIEETHYVSDSIKEMLPRIQKMIVRRIIEAK